LQLILAQQPNGPYRIIGSCKGALVAFDVAHRLTQMGQRVEFIGLIDPPTTNARSSMRLLLRLIKHVAPPAGLAWIYDQMNRYERLPKLSWKQRLLKAKTLMVKAPGTAVTPSFTLNKTYTPIMARYRPKPLAGPVVFYAAEFTGHRWRGLSPNLAVIELPGDHNSCIAVGAKALARDLRQRFNARSDCAHDAPRPRSVR
jgi:phthiocerol/phenolphthiocerol synthesis type-I polyketide synthase D